MGHERLGLLPKSDRWRRIVSDIAKASEGQVSTDQIVDATAQAIDARFRKLHLDPGIQDAFSFLVSLSIAGRSDAPTDALRELGIELGGGQATPIRLTQALSVFMQDRGGSLEYAALARAAAGQAMAEFYQQEDRQSDFLRTSQGHDPFEIWRKASDSAGFCTLARQFFANLTGNYINYFLDREASAVSPSLEAREAFHASLRAHVDRVARHSFETSKIAQSFAAGWYAKNATHSLPTRAQTRGFLGIAFNKIRDSLGREVA